MKKTCIDNVISNSLENGDSWGNWRRYVTVTLQKLSDIINEQNREKANFKIKIISNLNDRRL